MATETMSRPNVHIAYDQRFEPYHAKVATLACERTRNGGSLLDIGCGNGYTLQMIHRLNPSLKLTAADIDATCLATTGNRVELERSIQISETEELFELGQSFDTIVMSHVLEHTLRPLEVIRGIAAMLRPGGVAVVAVPNPVRMRVVLSNIRRKHYVNRGHAYAWDRSHWMNFLENIAGLDVECYAHDYFPLHPRLHRISFGRSIETKLGDVFPWLCFSNIAVIRSKATPDNDDASVSALSGTGG